MCIVYHEPGWCLPLAVMDTYILLEILSIVLGSKDTSSILFSCYVLESGVLCGFYYFINLYTGLVLAHQYLCWLFDWHEVATVFGEGVIHEDIWKLGWVLVLKGYDNNNKFKLFFSFADIRRCWRILIWAVTQSYFGVFTFDHFWQQVRGLDWIRKKLEIGNSIMR